MNAVATTVPTSTSDWRRNFIWLIKREIWEHRGRLLITPLVISAILIVSAFSGFMHTNVDLIRIQIPGFSLDANMSHVGAMQGWNYAVYLIFSLIFLAVMFFVTAYYAMDTLYADRRDRSLLFWKSLPISDVETVLSKLSVAAVIAPAIAVLISVATTLILFGGFSVALAAHGRNGGQLWSLVPVFQNLLLALYGLVVIILWYLPIWAWCLLASAWAQRAVFLWATVPIAGAWFLEYQTFRTNHIQTLLGDRITGMAPLAFDLSSRGSDKLPLTLSDLMTPGVFFSSPQLWIGILVAAILVAVTVWMRRYREPV